MSDFYRALRLHNLLLNQECSISKIRDQFQLTNKEMQLVIEFYKERGTFFEVEKDDEDKQDEESFDFEYDEDKSIFRCVESKNTSLSLIEKIDTADIINATFMANRHELFENVTDIFANSPIPVIRKHSTEVVDLERMKDFKKCWIDALIHHMVVNLRIVNASQKNILNVKPLGLYFHFSLNQFRLVFLPEKSSEVEEANLNHVKSFKECGRKFDEIPFSIDEYLDRKEKKEIVLRIYPEADVDKKLLALFPDAVVEKLEESDYDRMKILVDDPMEYSELMESYGMSVIIEEPKALREQIVKRTVEALDNYKKVGVENK